MTRHGWARVVAFTLGPVALLAAVGIGQHICDQRAHRLLLHPEATP